MGYRSEVAIALTENHYNQLFEAAKNVKDFDNTWLVSFLSNPKRKETIDETYMLITDDWIKWYSSYPEISFIENFLNNHRHAFIRIGEDDNDSEMDIMVDDDEGEDDMFYELIYLRREVNMDFFND